MMSVAIARTRQLMPLGTTRLMVATAHPILSGDGLLWAPSMREELVSVPLIQSAIVRTFGYGIVHNPTRIAPSGINDLKSNARSDAGKAMSLASGFIQDLKSGIR